MARTGSLRTRLGALAVAGLGATGHARAQATFEGLGYVPGGSKSWAYGVSDDGTVVVGNAVNPLIPGTRAAFRWTQASGMTNLGPVLGNDLTSEAFDVSANGSIVVGYTMSSIPSYNAAFTLSGAGPPTFLPIPPGYVQAYGYGVSGDGLIVAGYSIVGGTTLALRWTAAGFVNLGYLPGGLSAEARAISTDGSTIVGWCRLPGTVFQAFRWRADTGMKPLSSVPGSSWTRAYGVSADGGVVVGEANIGQTYVPVRWPLSGAGRALPGEGLATGVSGDGSVVVGSRYLYPHLDAFVWTPARGLKVLKAELEAHGSGPIPFSRLQVAEDVSADGQWFVGMGYPLYPAPPGSQAWRASLPAGYACYANCNGDWAPGWIPNLNVADFTCFQTRFVAGDVYGDCNDDGKMTIADFACFQTRFVAGCQ